MIQILEEHVSFRYSMMAESESLYKNGQMADSCKQPEITCFSSFLDFFRTPAIKKREEKRFEATLLKEDAIVL